MAEENRGCLWAILRLLGWRPEQKAPVPPATNLPMAQPTLAGIEQEPPVPASYHTRRFLLSARERAFYHVLKKAAGDRVVVCPQVRLADIFDASPREAFGKIAYRHVDFLLCHPQTFKPLAGVELDDSSHRRIERVKQDEFKEQVFQRANLRLIRVPVQESYDVRTMETKISEILAATPPDPVELLPEQDPLAPLCPTCGEVMVVRVAQHGFRKGRPFYSCSRFPQCRGILPYETVQ